MLYSCTHMATVGFKGLICIIMADIRALKSSSVTVKCVSVAAETNRFPLCLIEDLSRYTVVADT